MCRHSHAGHGDWRAVSRAQGEHPRGHGTPPCAAGRPLPAPACVHCGSWHVQDWVRERGRARGAGTTKRGGTHRPRRRFGAVGQHCPCLLRARHCDSTIDYRLTPVRGEPGARPAALSRVHVHASFTHRTHRPTPSHTPPHARTHRPTPPHTAVGFFGSRSTSGYTGYLSRGIKG